MTKKELYAHPAWQDCTFEGAEMSTLLLGLRSTFREKLEWLEAAENLVLKMKAGRETVPAPANPALNDAPLPAGNKIS